VPFHLLAAKRFLIIVQHRTAASNLSSVSTTDAGTKVQSIQQVQYGSSSFASRSPGRLGHAESYPCVEEEAAMPASEVAWSYIETRGSVVSTETCTHKEVGEEVTHQLQNWAYEVSNGYLTFAERLEKSKWEESSQISKMSKNKEQR